MRVTQSMLSNNTLRNLTNSYERLGKLQEQITNQKKFTKPSDDPVSAMMGMNYRNDLNQIQQYKKNIGEATNWVDTTDSALNQSVSALQRIRELTVQGSNGTYEGSQLKNMAEEIKQLKEHIQNIGDTQIGDKYIFNGQNTNVKPSTTGNYGSGVIELEVFSGVKTQINTDASNLFGDTLSSTGSIQQTIDALESGSGNISPMLTLIDGTIDQFLSTQAQVGARQNRVKLMNDRLDQQEVFSTQILSNNEDVDMEKVIMNLTTQESVHSAALSVGAKIMQPSLLDFLR